MTTMAPMEQISGKSTTALRILNRCVVLTLTRHYLGNHRKVDTRSLVENATDEDAHLRVDTTQFNTTKKLINQKELTGVMRELTRAQLYLRKMAIQSHRIFGERTYMVPIAAVQIVDSRLKEIRQAVLDEAALLATRYTAAVEEQREKLGPHFRASDYVTPAQVATAFDLDWAYVSFQAPEKLETVDQALFESARDKYEGKLSAAYDEVRIVLRMTLKEIVSAVAMKLDNGPDGERKVFQGSVLDELADFLSTFSMRNIADDDELADVVTDLRRVTSGVDVKQLRDIDAVRASVQAVARAATEQLDAMITVGRSVQLGGGRLE